MDILIIFCGVVMGIVFFSRSMTARRKEKEEADLLERNPEAWKALQQMKRDKSDRNRATFGKAAMKFGEIVLKR